jgi:transcription elongation GreA/GreB family factor
MTKHECFQCAILQLEEKINLLQKDMNDLVQGIAEDSKSSAGDKFETSREMSQQELNKLSIQLAESKRFLTTAIQLNNEGATSTTVELGNVVKLGEMHVLIGLPIGRIQAPVHLVGIGTAAPLSHLLLGKKNGQLIDWQGKSITVELLN